MVVRAPGTPRKLVRLPAVPARQAVLGKGITMWGATATGKTTFLAALYTALLDQDIGWRLRGADQPSTEALVALTNKLADEGTFPGHTIGIRNYRWSLVGTVPRAIKEWRWNGLHRRDLEVEIPLDLVDAAGEVADGSKAYGREVTQRFVDNLTNSTGIVFFYDPIREFEHGDAFRNTFGVLTQLDSKMGSKGKLPHHVAVCVTKFDEQRVFDAATAMRLVITTTRHPAFPGYPRVMRAAFSPGSPRFATIPRAGYSRCLTDFREEPDQVLRHLGDRFLVNPISECSILVTARAHSGERGYRRAASARRCPAH